jgi:hypothetical protein
MNPPQLDKNIRPCVVIISHKKTPNPFEAVSLLQCAKILNHFDTILVQPASNSLKPFGDLHPNLIRMPVPDSALATYAAFNKLKVDYFFYESFKSYSHVLFYELDAFVFRDELLKWCQTDIDYAGAPWIDASGASFAITGIGNGGFSLRRLSAVKSVLKSSRLLYRRREIFAKRHIDSIPLRYLCRPIHLAEWLFFNRFSQSHSKFTEPEDMFWGRFVRRSFPHFKYPTNEQAIAFAFESAPRALYDRNHQHLPFGCHGWWTYDFAFWRPKIEACGYSLPTELPPFSTSFLISRPRQNPKR